MSKALGIALMIVSSLILLGLGSLVKNAFFPNLSNLVELESIEGGEVCKSEVLVKNLGTEDQVVLKSIIYDKSNYYGSMVSPDTKCSRIFYSNALGGYTPPTQVPTKEGE